jgi:hypothetical protein
VFNTADAHVLHVRPHSRTETSLESKSRSASRTGTRRATRRTTRTATKSSGQSCASLLRSVAWRCVPVGPYWHVDVPEFASSFALCRRRSAMCACTGGDQAARGRVDSHRLSQELARARVRAWHPGWGQMHACFKGNAMPWTALVVLVAVGGEGGHNGVYRVDFVVSFFRGGRASFTLPSSAAPCPRTTTSSMSSF